MAVVFDSSTNFGRAVALQVQNVGVGNFGMKSSPERGFLQKANFLTDEAGRVLGGSSFGMGAKEVGSWFSGGFNRVPTPPLEYAEFPKFADNNFGFVTGITGGYSDSVEWTNATKVPSVSPAPIGRFNVEGIAFGAICDPSGTQRHGVEDVLHYYYWRRVSNDRAVSAKNNYLAFRIGQTMFYGWVIGVDFSQLDANFNIWRWTLPLAVSIKYTPRSLSGGLQNDGLTLANTAWDVGKIAVGGPIGWSMPNSSQLGF